ncbi:hypothetical protein MRB53_040170 [Persea americana]|nr:hypothetical protein MRB53_040170 [Persea americana]
MRLRTTKILLALATAIGIGCFVHIPTYLLILNAHLYVFWLWRSIFGGRAPLKYHGMSPRPGISPRYGVAIMPWSSIERHIERTGRSDELERAIYSRLYSNHGSSSGYQVDIADDTLLDAIRDESSVLMVDCLVSKLHG